MRRRTISTLLVAVAAALAAGAAATPAATSAPGREGCAVSSRWLATWRHTVAARARVPLRVSRQPGRTPFAELPVADRYGFATTVSVLERRRICGVSWYRVRLPVRDNGGVGWVRSKEVKTTPLRKRIVVDLSRRRLYLYDAGRVILRTPVAVGKPSTPTPRGSFYVTQRFVVTSPGSPFGPRALGISAFSAVLRSWRDGGPIGLHGTNERFSIGASVSHGCVRLPNAAIVRLFRVTPLGTPVVIRR